MKVKRYKRVQKYLTFYKNKFNFRTPYQVLIDGTFCQTSLQNKVNISEQMSKYLSDSCKLLTTVCVVEETQTLSDTLYGAMVIVKQFPIRRCGHEKSPIAANECLRQLICGDNNVNHYMLATQDPVLTRAVRSSTVCPLIYMKANTIVMERPNERVKESVKRDDAKSFDLSEHELNVLRHLKRSNDLEDRDGKERKRKRRKGPKGPNPLSCKKKMVSKETQKTSNCLSNDSKRKRKRKKGSKHIQTMFSKIVSQITEK